MIAWIMGLITFILLLFMLWRWRSKEARERFEQPKFQFLKNLGIDAQTDQSKPQDISKENKHAERNA
jgi:ribonuclease D